MSGTSTFGIVGGYGATGRVVASELWKYDGEILVGGRDLAKGKALAAEFDHRVSAVHLDILDVRWMTFAADARSLLTVLDRLWSYRIVLHNPPFASDAITSMRQACRW
ncbi:MAG TPA: hypothetical protein VKY85_23535 [Candidatus Angelobacter sp.]|nr:hypothetical protein [Candidatus Angelobacter sp.]